MTTAWHKGTMFVFDTETSGTSVDYDRIVTATIARIAPGQLTDARTWLINPGVDIPKAASDVHGISNQQAQLDGQDPAEAIAQIAQAIGQATRENAPVIAFNASFDFSILDRECRRHGSAFAQPFVVDPFVLDKELDKWRKGKRTLTATCEHYRVALNGAHDATEDALAAGRLAWRMAERWPDKLQIPLEDLHTKQAMWRFEWAEQFQEYLRRKDPTAVVNGEWPCQSLPADWSSTALPVAMAVAS
jgi:DNA polymerase-3 subunit epsilon